ncbi:hypothetical protein HBB16_07480 [Pseudonocardia sp. MCCB 268]|nr:hypothetical protein [Pseudonocardia cytotoxica]
MIFDGVRLVDRSDELRRIRAQMQMLFQDPFAALNRVDGARHHRRAISRPARRHGGRARRPGRRAPRSRGARPGAVRRPRAAAALRWSGAASASPRTRPEPQAE